MPQQYLVYYKGPFDDVILSRISDFIRNRFPESPQVSHTLFAIFVELAQNISRYSAEHNYFGNCEDKHGVGTMGIKKEADGYLLLASNLVDKIHGEEILERCNAVNGLDYEGLKALRKELRAAPRGEAQRGGNIGLIQVAMRAGTPIHVEMKPSESNPDLMHLIITVKVPIDAYSAQPIYPS